MKETIKQIIIRSLGLTLATFFGGTAIGAVAGNWWICLLYTSDAADE